MFKIRMPRSTPILAKDEFQKGKEAL